MLITLSFRLWSNQWIKSSSEAVEKPERGGDLSTGAHRGTVLPTQTDPVGRRYDEHDPALSTGLDRGAMDIALGGTSGAAMATGQARPAAV
jgi:hypothetical protein